MVGGALIYIVEQGRLDTILMRNVNWLAKSSRFMNSMMGRVVGNESFITEIAAFAF